MQIQWFNHLKDPQEQSSFKTYILSSKKVLDRAVELCYNRLENKEMISSEVDYESASWAYKQADRNGYIRAYKEIINLLSVDDPSTKK